VTRQSAVLFGNTTFYYEVESFYNDTYKDLTGWKLHLSPTSIKMNYKWENLNESLLTPTAPSLFINGTAQIVVRVLIPVDRVTNT